MKSQLARQLRALAAALDAFDDARRSPEAIGEGFQEGLPSAPERQPHTTPATCSPLPDALRAPSSEIRDQGVVVALPSEEPPSDALATARSLSNWIAVSGALRAALRRYLSAEEPPAQA